MPLILRKTELGFRVTWINGRNGPKANEFQGGKERLSSPLRQNPPHPTPPQSIDTDRPAGLAVGRVKSDPEVLVDQKLNMSRQLTWLQATPLKPRVQMPRREQFVLFLMRPPLDSWVHFCTLQFKKALRKLAFVWRRVARRVKGPETKPSEEWPGGGRA